MPQKVFPDEPAANASPAEPAVDFKEVKDEGSIDLTSSAFAGTERPLSKFEKSLFALVSG